MKLYSLTLRQIMVAGVCAVILTSCGGNENLEDSTDAKEKPAAADPNRSALLNVQGEIFSIPSPIQTALLIKKSGANYEKDILTDPKKVGNYTTKFQKALNLGVYGADLGYVTMYEQTQDALGYLKSVKSIADELGVLGAFDKTLMERFEKNMGNRDSLLVLVSDAYRASDDYLKANEQNDVGALILAGGWVESLYFAVKVAQTTKNPDMVKRIGEQKKSLENLIKLMSPYYNNGEFTSFVDGLIDLAGDFDSITYKYIYEAPTTDAAAKITTINSRTEVQLSEQQLQTISKKIEKIRNQIIG